MTPRPILFGKLPRHGDFVARGLDPAARDAWDGWAARGLMAAREALDEAFDRAHGAAPPWRFVVGPGAFGPGWRAGAVAPSIDSVGRSFVLVLAAEDLSPAQAEASGARLAGGFEDLIYRSLGEGLTADELIAAGAPLLSDLAEGEGVVEPRWWTEGGPQHQPQSIAGGAPAEELFRRMLTPTAVEAAP